MHAHRVRALLMGGQACVFYGAAEFSRDTDLVVLCEADNLTRLQRAVVDLHYFENRDHPGEAQIRFSLMELRTPELLIEVARQYTTVCNTLFGARPLLALAAGGESGALERGLEEEAAERQRDRQYWLPLRKELEQLRRRS